jgi:tripartite-type tricarboxylate transporter receptor subunit TctC
MRACLTKFMLIKCRRLYSFAVPRADEPGTYDGYGCRLRPPFSAAVLLMVTCCVAANTAHAQAWPVKPIRLVHGFIAGGSVDITARLLAAPLSELLGQQVVVDGRPGAGGTTAAGLVVKAEPDGYTLFLMASGHATSPALYRALAYDPVRDFTMITLVASNPFVIAAAANFPARTVADLVRMARAEPGRIDFATGGTGTGMHLAAVLLQARTGIKLNHIPYKGGNAAPIALLAGEVPLLFNTPAGIAAFMDGGKLRVLAITTAERFKLWPLVPTVAETVAPGFDVRAWYALAAPRGLSDRLVGRIGEAARAALKRPGITGKFLHMGSEITPTTPGEAQAFLAAEVVRWTKVIKDENIQPEN